MLCIYICLHIGEKNYKRSTTETQTICRTVQIPSADGSRRTPADLVTSSCHILPVVSNYSSRKRLPNQYQIKVDLFSFGPAHSDPGSRHQGARRRMCQAKMTGVWVENIWLTVIRVEKRVLVYLSLSLVDKLLFSTVPYSRLCVCVFFPHRDQHLI